MRPALRVYRTLRGSPRLRCAAVLCLLSLVAGCASLIPGSGPPPALYRLTPKSTFPSDLPDVSAQLVVDQPLASGGLDTNRIALRPRPTEVEYFAHVRWTDGAPSMVQALLVESFENSGHIVSVGRQVIGLRSDYNLLSELREFQADYFDGGPNPLVWVRLNAKLVRQPQQSIIASRSFQGRVRAQGNDMPAVIAAFDEALGKVLKHVVEWTLEQMARDERARAAVGGKDPRAPLAGLSMSNEIRPLPAAPR